MVRRRILITVETNQLLIMRQHARRIKTWCDVCNEQVEMLSKEDDEVAASVVQKTSHTRPEACKFHLGALPEANK